MIQILMRINFIRKILKKITTEKFRYKILGILESQKKNILEKKILSDYKETNDDEIKEMLEYIKSNGISMYNYNFIKKYINKKIKVEYDDKCKMYYVYHNCRKLYFSKVIDTKEKVERYYIMSCLEQDIESPHSYIFDKSKVYKCVLDIGAAEGNFSLEIIDNAKEIYLFESDANWIEALKHTFAPYKEKVHIIEKYVSNKTNKREVCLDDFFKDTQKEIDYIKIDIEGAELIALEGMTQIVNEESNNELEINICAYHKENHEREIRKKLTDFEINCKGYIMPMWDKKAYLRRGVLYCKKIHKL